MANLGARAPGLARGCSGSLRVLLAENSRIPVDDPTTHLELTMIHEVMVLDHGGPDLAFVLYASALKLFLFASLLVHMVLPCRLPEVRWAPSCSWPEPSQWPWRWASSNQ